MKDIIIGTVLWLMLTFSSTFAKESAKQLAAAIGRKLKRNKKPEPLNLPEPESHAMTIIEEIDEKETDHLPNGTVIEKQRKILRWLL